MALNKFILVTIFLCIGMFSGLFLIYEHFVPSASEFCSFGQSVDCGIVNKSPYANLDGISYLLTIDFALPLPLINISGMNPFLNLITSNAFLGVITLLLIWFMLYKHKKGEGLWFIEKEKMMDWILGMLIFGVLYGMYLFYIQHFILHTYCPFCITIDIAMIASLIIAIMMKKEESK